MAGEALLIVAHGDCGGERGNVLANELARRMRLSRRYDEVAVGYMKTAPLIEEAAARIGVERVRVFPLFMSDGYYVSDAIPRRLGMHGGIDAMGHEVRIETPLGLLPGLPPLLLKAAVETARGEGKEPGASHLLLVAHGNSNSSHSADTARQIASEMAEAGVFASVDTAFLEEKPFLGEVLAASPRPLFVFGLFAGCGMHGQDDLHAAVEALGDGNVHIVEQLGGYAGVIELIAGGLLG